MKFFTELEKKPKIYMKVQWPQKTEVILKKKSNARGITIADFKFYYGVT
jgi:hypothetical protein